MCAECSNCVVNEVLKLCFGLLKSRTCIIVNIFAYFSSVANVAVDGSADSTNMLIHGHNVIKHNSKFAKQWAQVHWHEVLHFEDIVRDGKMSYEKFSLVFFKFWSVTKHSLLNIRKNYNQASASLYKRLIEKSKPAGVRHLYQKSPYFWVKKIAG